jgi:hypothetical protein
LPLVAQLLAAEDAGAGRREDTHQRSGNSSTRGWKAQATASAGRPPTPPADVARAFADLYLMPSAPVAIVHAVYRALARQHHTTPAATTAPWRPSTPHMPRPGAGQKCTLPNTSSRSASMAAQQCTRPMAKST